MRALMQAEIYIGKIRHAYRSDMKKYYFVFLILICSLFLCADEEKITLGLTDVDYFIMPHSTSTFPACTTDLRFSFKAKQGGTEITDEPFLCIKNNYDVYEWKSLFSQGGGGCSCSDFSSSGTATMNIINASGLVTATFSGGLTGNVTGNVSGSSGSCTGNSATATSATDADHADACDACTSAISATNAIYATTAGTSGSADYSDTSGYSTNSGTATTATNAGHATTADSATSATTAGSATNATNATNCTNATEATHATSADTATSAGTAGSATDSTNAANIATATSSTSANFYPVFVSTTSGNLPAKVDAGLTYNPNTNILSSTFSGNITGDVTGNTSGSSGTCTGNAGSSTYASAVTVVADGTNATFYPAFYSATTGNLATKLDADLTYNPNTNTLTAVNYSGTIANATNAANVAIATDATAASFYVPFYSTTTGNLPTKVDAGIAYNPSTNVLTSTFSGNISGGTVSGTTITGTNYGGSGTVFICADNNGLMAKSATACAGGGGSELDIVVAKTARENSATTSLANVTDLFYWTDINIKSGFESIILFGSSITTTGIKLAVTSPAGATLISYQCDIPFAADGAGGTWNGSGTSSDDAITSTGVIAVSTPYAARCTGIVLNGSTAGNVYMRFGSEVASSGVYIYAGSTLKYRYY